MLGKNICMSMALVPVEAAGLADAALLTGLPAGLPGAAMGLRTKVKSDEDMMGTDPLPMRRSLRAGPLGCRA